jgi:hypothetical protein
MGILDKKIVPKKKTKQLSFQEILFNANLFFPLLDGVDQLINSIPNYSTDSTTIQSSYVLPFHDSA